MLHLINAVLNFFNSGAKVVSVWRDAWKRSEVMGTASLRGRNAPISPSLLNAEAATHIGNATSMRSSRHYFDVFEVCRVT